VKSIIRRKQHALHFRRCQSLRLTPGNTCSLPESLLQEMADTIESSLSEYGANVEAEITG